MRRIVEHPKNIRLEGIVESNGIGFKAMKAAGPLVAINTGYFASADDEGKITTHKMNDADMLVTDYVEEEMFESNMDKKIKEYSKTSVLISVLLMIGCLIMSFVSASWSGGKIWSTIFSNLIFVMIATIMLSKGIAIFLANTFGNQEMRSFSQYLAAKNAVQNAYYDLRRVPNLEEVKDYSIFSTDCKYMKMVYPASLCIIISLVNVLDGGWYWLGAILAIIVLCTLEWKSHLTFWQVLIADEPDDEHYEVAIKALEEVVDWIDYLEISVGAIINSETEGFSEEKCRKCPGYDFCKEVSNALKGKSREEPSDIEDNTSAEEITADASTESEGTSEEM